LAGLHLKNVAIRVVEDPPYYDRGQDGLLGLPVVLALNRFSWNQKSMQFNVLPASLPAAVSSSNLALEGIFTFSKVGFKGATLGFFLDTGSSTTLLYPLFAHSYPEITYGAQFRRKGTTKGAIGLYLLQSPIPLTFGGKEVTLVSAYLLADNKDMNEADWFSGTLGIDHIEGSDVEFDLSRMNWSSQ
jgi:hypothetical protein